jgi:diguanylate cyclase (GGDEF)-like protein
MTTRITRQFLLSCTLAVLSAATVRDASALCLPYADPQLQRYEKLMGVDPSSVADGITAELSNAKLKKVERSTNGDVQSLQRAALYSLQAEAFGSLERYAEARDASQSGLALIADVRNPVHINLMHQLATNSYDEKSIPGVIESIEAARRVQPSGSQGEACLLISLGALEHFAGRGQQAGVHLTQAYRQSAGPERKPQRVLAADVLSLVMSDQGDFSQAQALLQEVIDDETEQGAMFDLAVSRFMRGAILRDAKDHRGALVEFEASRTLGAKMNDTLGVAYANLYMCMTNIDLAALIEARAQCLAALPSFAAAEAIDPKKQTLAALAELDLRENQPATALKRVNLVFDDAKDDLAQVRLAPMYELRARAHAALGSYQQALDDYQNYMQRTKSVLDKQRMRETASLRARFETDREIERNEFLKRELAAQSGRLRWMIAAAVAGGCIVLLLTLVLLANRRQKLLLALLARQDDLTALPNRRRMLELANDAFATSRKEGELITVALIDLDHFKQINDRFGHAAGDFVLQEFARMCRQVLRESDEFGRWGGEEFLIVLPKTTLDVALGVIERVRIATQSIRGPLFEKARLENDGVGELRVSLSAGLATNEGDPSNVEEIISKADVALYNAKKGGRDLVCVAPESYSLASTGIRRALKSSGVALQTGKFARWQADGSR